MLTAAGLLIQSLIKLQNVDSGFNPENVLVMRLAPNWSRFSNTATSNAQFVSYFRRMLERVSQPGVVEASVASTYPLNPAGIKALNNIAIQEGRPRDDTQPRRKSIHVP